MALNNAPLVETDFSTFYLTYGYHHTFYHDLQQFTVAVRRMKELHWQFLASLLVDLNHVSEMYGNNQDRYVQRSNKPVKAHRFRVVDMVLVSAATHPRNQPRPKHPLVPKASIPFIIEAAIGPRTFSLNLPPWISRKFHNSFHKSDLIQYIIR